MMNKHLIAIGITLVLVIIGLIGCMDNSTNNEDGDDYDYNEWDSDNDGYADNIDDFPTDPNLHKKTIWYEFKNERVAYTDDIPEIHSIRKITSDIKYVEWNWVLEEPSPYSAKINFHVDRESEHSYTKLYEIDARADSNRIIPDYSNIGSWDVTWLNYPYPDEGWGALYVTGSIYSVK